MPPSCPSFLRMIPILIPFLGISGDSPFLVKPLNSRPFLMDSQIRKSYFLLLPYCLSSRGVLKLMQSFINLVVYRLRNGV